jgi:hypothetical protein
VQGKLALAKSRGELVEQAEVTKFLSQRARMERDSWLAWASAVAGQLAVALRSVTANGSFAVKPCAFGRAAAVRRNQWGSEELKGCTVHLKKLV